MSHWDTYNARVNLHGTTQRERVLNQFTSQLGKKTPSSLSYKKVKLNGEDTHLIIDSDTKTYYKSIKSLHDQKFEVGDYVVWANAYWIVIEADYDDELYIDGRMQQCNWQLAWQKPDGTILHYWCIDENATQYNSGESGNKIITLGSAQHMLTLPCDENTVLLDTPQRFFLDKNPIRPTTYKVTQNDTTTYNYGKGLCKITVTQDVKHTVNDNLALGICDYFTKDEIIEQDLNESNLSLKIVCTKPTLLIKRERAFTAMITDIETGQEIEITDIVWELDCDFQDTITQTIENNTLKLMIQDKNFIGKTFRLICKANEVESELVIEIKAFI